MTSARTLRAATERYRIRQGVRWAAWGMSDSIESLILDLLQWIGPERRDYGEVLDAWRTSCPRLPVWEEASNRGFVTRSYDAGCAFVCVTPDGLSFLHARRPTSGCSRRQPGVEAK
jgi:hypothetical protein